MSIVSSPARVRAIAQTDIRHILRMINTAWRVYIHLPPPELGAKIKTMPGVLAEDRVGLRGFMVIEPQPPDIALFVAAGLRDTWSVKPYLDRLLPAIEQAARTENLWNLVHIGRADWLVDELRRHGFETREWIVVFERIGVEPPPAVPAPAAMRTAHHKDLPALLALDALTFEHIWRKSAGKFSEALASADSFMVAEVAGRIVGYEWCEIYGQHAHLTRLAVHPGYQGHGIGTQLLHWAITDALARGVNQVTLNTQEDNYRSHSLYRRFGFVNTGQRMPILWKDLK